MLLHGLAQFVLLYGRLVRFPFPPAISQLHVRGTRDGKAGLVMFSDEYNNFFLKIAAKLLEQLPGLVSIGIKTYRDYVHLAGPECLTEAIGRTTYQIPINAFFQTNYAQTGMLLKTARELLNLKSTETLMDLHCGVGLFAIDLAPHVERVLGVETNRDAIRAAKENATANKVANAEFFAGSAEQGLHQFSPGEIDALIMDPPRMGCGEPLLAQLARVKPARILYVSCEPEKLAGDCRYLVDHGYRITDCVPMDMFPHTYHIETAVKLVLNR